MTARGIKMTEVQQIPILIPLEFGTSAIAGTIFVHALAVGVTVNLVRHERRLGRAGAGSWIDVQSLQSRY
jgi:hypothetical protein